MSEFYFIRHGETDWNVQGLMQGSTDIPLNDTGRAQARAAQHVIHDMGITRIIASPLQRAYETAQILNEPHGLPLDTHKGMAERSFGIYEGKHRDNAPITDGRIADGHPHEKIESYDAVIARALATIEETQQRFSDERILYVSHGGIYAALHTAFLKVHKGCNNAVPYHFCKGPECWTITELPVRALKFAG